MQCCISAAFSNMFTSNYVKLYCSIATREVGLRRRTVIAFVHLLCIRRAQERAYDDRGMVSKHRIPYKRAYALSSFICPYLCSSEFSCFICVSCFLCMFVWGGPPEVEQPDGAVAQGHHEHLRGPRAEPRSLIRGGVGILNGGIY